LDFFKFFSDVYYITMSIFTSVELITSIYVSYRVGNANIRIDSEGDNRRNCIR
jgi:hypothetical protein